MHFYYSITNCQKTSIFYPSQISPSLLFTIVEATLNKGHRNFERVQWRATKFILNNYHLDYKSRLPLMYFLELNDILFLVKSLNSPNPAFNIHNYVTFNTSVTQSGTFNKLIHNFTSTSYAHNFFNRIVRLWNSLPYIDLSLSVSTIKSTLQNFLWNHFVAHYDSDNVHTFHYLCPCNSCSHLPHCTSFL